MLELLGTAALRQAHQAPLVHVLHAWNGKEGFGYLSDFSASTPPSPILEHLQNAFLLMDVVIYLMFAPSFLQTLFGRGAAYSPTAVAKIDALFGEQKGVLREGSPMSILGSKAKELRFVDLGSGTGTIVRAAARTGGFGRSCGYEINPSLHLMASLLSTRTAGAPSAAQRQEQFYSSCLWQAPLGDADVVYVYGDPTMLLELGRKIGRECRDGTIVVSNAFAVPRGEDAGAEGAGRLRLIREVPITTRAWELDGSSSLWVYRVHQQGSSLRMHSEQ